MIELVVPITQSELSNQDQVSESQAKSKKDKTPLKECNLIKPRPERFYATPTKDFSKIANAPQENKTQSKKGDQSAKVQVPADCAEDKENTESLQQSFSDDNVSLNTSASKSPLLEDGMSVETEHPSLVSPLEVTSSQQSFPIPQVLVFGNTQKLDTGLLLLAKDTGKSISTPAKTPKKSLLKTPGSVSKRRSVCFIDGRNETAYLASASDDLDFVPGIIRVSSKVTEDEATDEPSEKSMVSVNRKRPAILIESSPNPRMSKKRRIRSDDQDRVRLIPSANDTAVHYIEMINDAPGMLDIKEYFQRAAEQMSTALINLTFQASSPSSTSAPPNKNSSGQDAKLYEQVAQSFLGNQKLNKGQLQSMQNFFNEASDFLFKKAISETNDKERDILKICFENAKPSSLMASTKFQPRKPKKQTSSANELQKRSQARKVKNKKRIAIADDSIQSQTNT
eukprot:748412-Hanusia_phi.AAC.1